jgi:hypothetical protein
LNWNQIYWISTQLNLNSKIGLKQIKENEIHIGGEGIEHDIEKKKLLKKQKSEKIPFHASLFENGLNLF